MSVLVQRAKESGTCPPSLLSEDNVSTTDSFEQEVLKLLDNGTFQLAPSEQAMEGFKTLLEAASSSAQIEPEEKKKSVLEQRRAILLAIVAASPHNSPSVSYVMTKGYLKSVKEWLDEILDGKVGAVDLLLHLLKSIANLPVTKAVVKDSGMGRAIGAITKHGICKDTPNEEAIESKVQEVKDSWHASVKALKSTDSKPDISTAAVEGSVAGAKRSIETSPPSPSPVKRIKTTTSSATTSSKNLTAFSSLLTKISGPEGAKSASSSSTSTTSGFANGDSNQSKKNSSKRVKWADHFGGDLSKSTLVEAEPTAEVANESSVSWSDRKKRDRMREKELLSKVKRAKLMDEDDDLDMARVETPTTMVPTMAWREPNLLPPRPEVSPPPLVSVEFTTQNERMKTVAPTRYASDHEVPANPTPLSDIEQALDMTSQSSALVETMPFFIPVPAAPAPEPEPVYDTVPKPQPYVTGATVEFVQYLG